MPARTARQGDTVRIRYTARLDDGTVFDSNVDGPPTAIVAGSREFLAGLSEAVVGMAEGEARRVEVDAPRAYGARDESLVQSIPRDLLPEGVAVGDALQATAAGETVTVWVRALGADDAVVDANHPLAGRDLRFDIELVAVDPAAGRT